MKQYTLDEFKEHPIACFLDPEGFEVTYNTKPYVRVSYDTTSNLARVLRNTYVAESEELGQKYFRVMWFSGLDGNSKEGMQTFSIVSGYYNYLDQESLLVLLMMRIAIHAGFFLNYNEFRKLLPDTINA